MLSKAVHLCDNLLRAETAMWLFVLSKAATSVVKKRFFFKGVFLLCFFLFFCRFFCFFCFFLIFLYVIVVFR